jgi:outer membrane murein-binding lipoprotein Lpp
MKRRLDSIILGGAMLFGGMAHRRAGHVAQQVEELGDAVEAVEVTLREVAAAESAPERAHERPSVPGMPLPTGYGLQVRGPDDENIIIPVCLPPGFELGSMVLCPEFLPRDEPQAAPAPPPPPAAAPARVAVAAPAPRPPVRERLSGTLQYVFGNEPGYSVDESFGGEVDADPPRPARTSGVETHHL